MQPKTVLHDYLADLLGEPDSGQTLAEAAPGYSQSAVSPTKEPAGEFQVDESFLTAANLPEIPEWAQNPFQILLFRFNGINLAVPLNDLDSITRWNGKSTPIPGQPKWQPGLLLHQEKKVSLVDLSSLIMPERAVTAEGISLGYLLLVGGARWGLICDTIQRPRLISADDMRWSRNHKNRPWSYGFVVENLAALLNVGALLRILGMNDA